MHWVNFRYFILEFFTKIRPWLVVFSAASFVFLVNSSYNFNVITPYLNRELNFNAAEVGFLFACYYYSNILTVFWAGIILDKYSAKKILITSFILTNCSILIFANAKSFALLALSRLILGVAGSFSMLNCFLFITRWFPAEKITLVTGLATTCTVFGNLVAQTPLMLVIEKLGWRAGFMLNFWLGILLCFLAIIFTRDFPPGVKQHDKQYQVSNNWMVTWGSIKKVIANRQNWLIGICAFLYSIPPLFFGTSWGIVYLQEVKNLLEIEGSYVTSANVVGTIIGASLIGWLSDKFSNRKLPLIISSFFMLTVLIVISVIVKIPLLMLIILFFLFGLMANSQVVNYSLIAENNSSSSVGTAVGFLATLTALSGICMPFLGWLIDYYTSNNHSVAVQQISRKNNYYYVMLVLITLLVINIFLTLFIKETHGRQQRN